MDLVSEFIAYHSISYECMVLVDIQGGKCLHSGAICIQGRFSGGGFRRTGLLFCASSKRWIHDL